VYPENLWLAHYSQGLSSASASLYSTQTYACSKVTHHLSTFSHTMSQVSSQSSLKCFSSAQHQEKSEREQAQDGQPAPKPRRKSRKGRAKMISTAAKNPRALEKHSLNSSTIPAAQRTTALLRCWVWGVHLRELVCAYATELSLQGPVTFHGS